MSILRGQRGESVAIAGEGDTFEHAMLEAAGLLAAGAPSVLAVIAEEMPPAPYTPWISDVPFSYALGLRLDRVAVDLIPSPPDVWELQLRRNESNAPPCAWPHALDFLRVLQTSQPSLEHSWKTRQWTWQCRR